MNPRRPTPSGPEPHTPLPDLDPSSSRGQELTTGPSFNIRITPGRLARFLRWCMEKGTSEETCKQYARYLLKPFDPDNKWSRLAYKAWFKFTGKEDLWKEIKVKRSGIDLYIPSDEDVFTALTRACSSSEELCWIYKILVYSGLRLSEVVKLINEHDEEKWIKLNGFYKYPLSWKRGSKQAFYCYTIEKPPRIQASNKWISNWASKNKLLPPKYIRKWVATKMLGLGIPEEVVNFIQGRIPQEILSKHYLKLTTLADQYYQKYAEWLKQNIISKLYQLKS
ncbi:hypothetical protein J4526_01400 [Desulfurococcaceae archaeon MEX13E-LK6-19]|nr:hypothetical protein J4526_01400 [Desulfurococcaceae archaeon MEX13E-LK6-19]